jgi:nicotinamide riboside kinase
MRKIALIGTHGTGKTTLVHELVAEAKKRGVNAEFLGEIVRGCPLPINEQQTKDASEWIIYNQYIKELELKQKCNVLVCDRSVLDGYVYFYKKFGRDPILERFVKDKSTTYSALLRVPINQRRLTEDGVRATDEDFQRSIDKGFSYLLRELDIPFVDFKDIDQALKLIIP